MIKVTKEIKRVINDNIPSSRWIHLPWPPSEKEILDAVMELCNSSGTNCKVFKYKVSSETIPTERHIKYKKQPYSCDDNILANEFVKYLNDLENSLPDLEKTKKTSFFGQVSYNQHQLDLHRAISKEIEKLKNSEWLSYRITETVFTLTVYLYE